MSPASTCSKEDFEPNVIPSQLRSAHNTFTRPSLPATEPTPSYPPGERLHNTSRRKAIPFATGQAATAGIAATVHNAQLAFSDNTTMEDVTDSQAEVAQVTASEDTIMTDAAAIPPECEAIQVRSNKPVRASTILIVP